MVLHIQYKDDTFDYVNHRKLDALINEKAIKQFYRPQEKKWIDIEIDPIRRESSGPFTRADRRQYTSY
jgi:hypothetical protein